MEVFTGYAGSSLESPLSTLRHDCVRHRRDLDLQQYVGRRLAGIPPGGAGVSWSKVLGGDPLAVALSINVGSALVDVSPLSTLGALCVANVL